ncbi:hypothetical protein PV325_009425 [Microctonus aethiopoides]|nr:hypothetical protein PV325_009425 [Microctonus aethiopoides]KAK0093001.1 hypothetical protein PV326_000140 [Microctonus aethiopoides]
MKTKCLQENVKILWILSSTSSEPNIQRQEPMELTFELNLDQSQLFTQGELDDSIRNLGLCKESAQLFGAKLQAKHLLALGTQ